MADQLSDYIKKEREKGFDDVTIMKALLSSGYSEERVKQSFGIVPGQQKEAKAITSEKPASAPNKKYAIITVIAVLIIAILVVFLIFGTKTTEHNVTDTKTVPKTIPSSNTNTEKVSALDENEYYAYDENHNRILMKGAGCLYETRRESLICKAIFTGNISYCSDIENPVDRPSCIESATEFFAVITSNPKVCNKISAESEKRVCKLLSSPNQDSTVCGSAPDASSITICKDMIAAANKMRAKDISACSFDYITDQKQRTYYESMYKDVCIDAVQNADKVGKSTEPCLKYYDPRCA